MGGTGFTPPGASLAHASLTFPRIALLAEEVAPRSGVLVEHAYPADRPARPVHLSSLSQTGARGALILSLSVAQPFLLAEALSLFSPAVSSCTGKRFSNQLWMERPLLFLFPQMHEAGSFPLKKENCLLHLQAHP